MKRGAEFLPSIGWFIYHLLWTFATARFVDIYAAFVKILGWKFS
jgi:hypothetical protein